MIETSAPGRESHGIIGHSHTKSARRNWKAIPAVLALAAISLVAGAQPTRAQQTTPPATPPHPVPSEPGTSRGKRHAATTPTIRSTVPTGSMGP